MEANQKNPDFVQKRKCTRKRKRRKLLVGEKVEVRSSEDGFLGSWHSGTVIAVGKRARCIRYDHLLADNGEDNVIDTVPVSKVIDGINVANPSYFDGYRGSIRPLPPKLVFDKQDLRYGLCVDVYHVEAWWEGVILDHEDGSDEWKIFFPDLGDVMNVGIDSLRITQEWDELKEAWHRRGTWLFLELIEEHEKENFIPVSVKQLWYDVRVKNDLDEIGEWTCSKRLLWAHLVLDAIQDNVIITINHFLQELDVPQSSQLENELSSKVSGECSNHENSLTPGPGTTHSDSDKTQTDELKADEQESVSYHSEGECERPQSFFALPCGMRWEPIDSTNIPEPQFCPRAASQYVRKACQETATDVWKHLKYMGWTMEHMRDPKYHRKRYISPDGSQIEYSLRKICLELMEKDKTQVFPMAVHDTEESCQPSLPLSFLDANSDDDSEHIVDTLKAYLKIKNGKGHTKEIRTIQEKVRTHLSAKGWTFSKKFYGSKYITKYTSPSGYSVCTLKDACRKYLETRPSKNVDGAVKEKVGFVSSNEFGEVQEIRHLKRKRKSDSPSFQCNSMQRKISSEFQTENLDMKRRKKSGTSMELSSSFNGNEDRIRVLRSSKRLIQVATPSSTYQDPRTVLSWLIDNKVIPPEENIYCDGKDRITRKEGKITRNGIKCDCCGEVFTISSFALHAGSEHRRPAADIFLEDARSLLDCQIEANEAREKAETDDVLKRKWCQGENDDVCSVCLYGGDLLLCDGCPSSYHKSCIGLEDVPDDDWFCPTCFCGICGKVNLKEDQYISCHQCERKYHVCCLPNQGADNMLEKDQKESWFCSDDCKEIFVNLQKLVGTQTVVGSDNLTWALMKSLKSENSELDPSEIEACAENDSKLNVAVDVMHECFEPLEETQSRGDIVKDVIFSRSSKLRRLNFRGFYTILLERNEELIAVATIRILGKNAAEIPLIATRFQYRCLGMCRILMDELEKKLTELGVERLVLPAAPCVLTTWINSFGFSTMADSERKSLLQYTFLDFQDTVMCQKLLPKNPLPDSISSKENLEENRISIEQQQGHVLRRSSVISTYYTRRQQRRTKQ